MAVMTIKFNFRPADVSKIEACTIDFLIEMIKHDLAIFVIGGAKTDMLADWCQCRDRKTRAYIPLVIWKYYHQAMHFFKIGAFDSKMIHPYLISMQDLNPSILRELAELDHDDRNFVLKQAVGKLFEDINSKLYHISISKLLEVELVD
jgi:hypothetical protein